MPHLKRVIEAEPNDFGTLLEIARLHEIEDPRVAEDSYSRVLIILDEQHVPVSPEVSFIIIIIICPLFCFFFSLITPFWLLFVRCGTTWAFWLIDSEKKNLCL